MKKFSEGVDELLRAVRPGKIVAGCKVNQPYAQNQHETDSFRHDDGRSHYLGGPLLEHAFELVEEIARGAITSRGSDIDKQMIKVAETMARYVFENAPKDDGELSLSGNPWVKDDGILIYDRPPLMPREPD